MSPLPRFYWAWGGRDLEVIVPKQNGKGFLACPAGHHASPRIRKLEEVSGCDVCGLDGLLEFEMTHKPDIRWNAEKRAEFQDRVFPVIEELYKCQRGEEISYHSLCTMVIEKATAPIDR